ncbi:MAG TPA: AsmA-like C-terminal region-containing protein [Burkholderiales bacterium]|nr:AsmA-like C-terminal region-containing protein [Burkholderiales bacterium]
MSSLRGHLLRAARYAAYAAAALALLLAGAAFVLPLFLDTPAVERELQSKLSALLRGEVGWERLSIRLLPSPRGTLSRVRIEIPGAASVRAERVDANLRLLPLLRGRVEIASVGLSKPAIRVQAAPPPREGPRAEVPADPVQGYRSIVEDIRKLAPRAVIDVEDGEVEVDVSGIPPIRVRALELHGRSDRRGMEIELKAASGDWRRLEARAKVDFGDFSGAANLDLAGLKPQAWLDHFLRKSPVGVAVPEASLRIDARSDGGSGLKADFELRAATVELLRAAERVRIPDVAAGGTVTASGEEIAVRVAGAQLGASRLSDASLRYALKGRSLASSADFDLDLTQTMDATRRMLPEDAAKSLAGIQSVAGRAQGRATFEADRSWSALVDIRRSDSSLGIEGLPGPVSLAAGSVRVTGDSVRIDRADVAMLDARALASARIGYGKRLQVEAAVSEGSVGENLLDWVWKRAGAPPHLALKAPFRVAAERATWSPGRPLEVAATASLDAGPGVEVELSWTPGLLDIRRAAIKDAKSDAAVELRLEKDLLQGRFSGALQGASIGALLRGAQVPSGGAAGDLRFRVDLGHPERFTVAGKLSGENMDLAWLLRSPVTIERADLQADGRKLRIRRASVNWGEQRFALSGEVARAADGAPVVDAQIDSPGVLVDALLKPAGTPPPAKAGAGRNDDEPLWTLWPLPVRGQIAFRSKFVRFGEREAEPVAATLTLEATRAHLDLQRVQLCGISFPLMVDAQPKGQISLSVKLAANRQQLEQTALCLTERGVQIDGEFDLTADIRTRGTRHELVRNLEGTVHAEAREGKVKKFAMLGSILSAQSVASMFKEGGPKVDEKGFPYRSITASGRFDKGLFIIDEAFFRSDVIGLAANGSIGLSGGAPKPYDSNLTVLVAPLGRLDEMMRKVPLLGYVVGGTLTSVPVRVSEDIRDPLVVPLGPKAVLSELTGVFERALKLPGHVLPKPPQPPAP